MTPEPLVRLRGVVRRYSAGGTITTALHNFDLDVSEGELLAVIGPSGSGKTTLMGVIGGLDTADAGSVVVDEIDVNALRGEALAGYRLRTVGFVFQSPGLMPLMTALENIALPLQLMGRDPSEAETLARDALGLVGLEARGRHRAFELSGGEQQRVALARALAKRPRLLLADEPTGQLDSETSAAIIELIRSVHGRTTIIVATHDDAVASMADRRVRIEDGTLIAASVSSPGE
jgi:putative ABC transport system ATP-binding protein